MKKIMTPYELRFQIFQQAQAHVLEEYHHRKEMDASAPFPSYEEIEALAKKINTFVSQDRTGTPLLTI